MHKEDHDQIAELIPEFALGTLSADEAALVGQHVEGCAACQQELATYEAVVAALSLAAPTADPSPNLKDQLLEQIERSPMTGGATTSSPSWWQVVTSHFQDFLRGPRWQPVLALAVIAVLVSAVFFWRQNIPAAGDQFELTATDAAPDAEGLIEVAANGRDAMLTVNGLPPLSPEEQYQLWLIVDGQRASGAVFSVDAGGSAVVTIDSERPLAEYGAFGITIEPAGGSPGPTGQRVLGFNL